MIFCCMPPEKFRHRGVEHAVAGEIEAGEQLVDTLRPCAIAAEEAAMRPEMGEQQIFLHGKVGNDVLRAAVLGDEAETRADRRLGTIGAERLAVQEDRAAGARTEAEDRLSRLGAAGADETAEAEDLALVDLEGDVVDERRRLEMRDLQRDRSRHRVLLMALGIDRAELGADHGADKLGLAKARGLARVHDGAGPRAAP